VKSEPRAFASLSSGLLARKGAARPAMRPQGFGQGGGNLDDLGWNDMGHDLPRPVLAPVGEDGEVPQLSRTPLAGLTPISPVHDQQAEIEERFSAYGEPEDANEEEGEEEQVAASYGSLTSARLPQHEILGEDEDEDETLELDQPSSPASVPAFAAIKPALAPLPEAIEAEEPVAIAPPTPAPVPAPAPVKQVMPKPSLRAPIAAEPRGRPEPMGKGKAAFTLRLDPARHLKLRLACAVTGKSAQQLVTRALDELLASMPELDAMAERAPVERASN